MANEIELSGITKRFGSIVAVDDVSITIPAGDFVTLVGPSGSGKTTLLRIIAGLEAPSEGEVRFSGEDMTDLSPQERPLSMVFQDIALYPHMSCRENIGFGLKIKGMAKEERNKRIESAARNLQIEDQIDKAPAELSGGQQQRVALGRAFVEDPEVLLFDEPMSDLDANLKEDLRVEFQRLHRDLDATFVYVTHDQNEAMTMSDRIAVMNTGSVEQFDTPDSVFNDPVSEFVATFIGTPSTNIIPSEVSDGVARAERIELQLPPSSEYPERMRLGIRPQHLSIGQGDLSFDVEVDVVETIGTEYIVHTSATAADLNLDLITSDLNGLEQGDRTTIGASYGDIYLFDQSGDRIRTDAMKTGVASGEPRNTER
ncbi:ABC transporter ATP-binding protein [Salinirubellus sp. GCM10025818]|uniref:ABC transporter ATP-binding protein n=1 Tax=Salinirubellus TaxID=2162630 RepID=UPI0030D589C6